MWREVRNNRFHIGAIAPSSANLAEQITKLLPDDHPPRRILEVGAGTGPFSRALAEKLGPDDHLVLSEINDCFAKMLEDWRTSLEEPKRDQIRVIGGDILKFKDEPFHHIICGLPFTNFPPFLVLQFFEHFRALSFPSTTLSFYEYWGVRPIQRRLPGQNAARIRAVDDIIQSMAKTAQTGEVVVWKNVPPARVRHFRVAALPKNLKELAQSVNPHDRHRNGTNGASANGSNGTNHAAH